MPTIATSTTNVVFGYPPNPTMDLNVITGELWVTFLDQASRAAIYKSTDQGVSWSFQGNFVVTGRTLDQIAQMRIDAAGRNMHLILMSTTDGGVTHRADYKRIDITSGAPDLSTGALTFAGPGTAYTSGALVPVVNPDGSIHVFCAVTSIGARTGWTLFPITVAANTQTFLNPGLVSPTKSWSTAGTDSSISVTLDLEHNGNGITSSSPSVWMSALIGTETYVARATWKGYKTGWQTPGVARRISTNGQAERDNPAVWDGKRYLIMRPAPSAYTTMQLFEANSNNTGNAAVRLTPAHPQGLISGAKALSYNYITQDTRIWAVGQNDNTKIYYIDFIRATATFGAWTLTGWPAPTTAVTSQWGLRRGTYGTAQYDAFLETGTTSPYTVTNQIQPVNFAPTAPDWVTGVAGTVSQNGAAFDVSTSLTLDWNYRDPNATDVQASYALQRQIGAGTVQWWRASDSTWQTVETFNTSATSALTLAAANWLGAGGAADPAHTYKVATKDSGGLTSTYSAGLALVPSARIDPTLTAPTAAQILNTGIVDVTWTVAEQGAWRIVLINTASGATVYDSGFQTDPNPSAPTTLEKMIPSVLLDGFAGQIQLTTKNAEGLSSLTRTVNFTIDFVEPVAPTVTTLYADKANGGMQVAVTSPAAVGAQPVTTNIDIWRRKRLPGTYLPLNANPYFETNATDWTSSGYSTVARSTAFAHTGTASLLLTPTGAAATPKAQTTALYPITVGGRYEFRGWLRPTTANKTLRIYIDWYDAGSVLLSSTARDLTAVAGVWIWGWVRGTAPATATQARIAVGELATPAVGDTVYADELQLLPANDDDGIRIVTGATSGTAYLDWRAVTGVDYEYRAYAEAANGTSVWSQWQG